MEVVYTDWGVANRFSDSIEMNRNLKKYPHLHKKILAHELRHTNNFFSIEDLKNDLSSNDLNHWDMIKFMFKHPKSFSQLLPIYWTKKHGIVYDINLSLMWLFIIGAFAGVVFLTTNFI